MYCTRPVSRSPSAYRIISQAPHRNASYFSGFPVASVSSPFFGRAATFDPFRGLERVLEDFASPSFLVAPQQATRQQSFQPRFDVRENNGTYELRGEIPGVESKDLEVEFSDPQTLIVRGRTEHESTQGTPPQAIQSSKGKEHATETTTDNAVVTQPAALDNSDAASISSTGSYQKPSVEDATEGAETTTEAQPTPATTPGVEQQTVAVQAQPEAPQQTASQSQGHYWVSERSTGSFQRTFKFPHRVDQEAVTASLKNGILNIVVPKAAKPEARRIQVE